MVAAGGIGDGRGLAPQPLARSLHVQVLRNQNVERWLGREAELEAQAEEVSRTYAAALNAAISRLPR